MKHKYQRPKVQNRYNWYFKPLPRSAPYAKFEVYLTWHCDSGTNPPSGETPLCLDKYCQPTALHCHHSLRIYTTSPLYGFFFFFFFSRAPKGALLRRRNKSYAVTCFFSFGRSNISGSILPVNCDMSAKNASVSGP